MSTPTVEAPMATPARPWFKKKRFILPLVGLAVIIIASNSGGSKGTPAAD
jgi:hypothetical protein